jgi:hypothetical protein
MGNIVTGYELISRVHSKPKREVFGILLPLITSESGDKFGKSAGAPVWLSEDKTSPFDFYQVLRMIQKCLKLFKCSTLPKNWYECLGGGVYRLPPAERGLELARSYPPTYVGYT